MESHVDDLEGKAQTKEKERDRRRQIARNALSHDENTIIIIIKYNNNDSVKRLKDHRTGH